MVFRFGETNGAIVGGGQGAADTTLQRRAQSPVAGLTRTILGVYEAKKAAEKVEKSIGPKTVICIQQEGRDARILKEAYINEVLEPTRVDMQKGPGPLPELPPPTKDAYHTIDPTLCT